MEENKKYVELLWHQKYDKIELGEKTPIEKPNLPFQTVETINKPRIKEGITAPLFPEDEWPKDYPVLWLWNNFGSCREIRQEMDWQ